MWALDSSDSLCCCCCVVFFFFFFFFSVCSFRAGHGFSHDSSASHILHLLRVDWRRKVIAPHLHPSAVENFSSRDHDRAERPELAADREGLISSVSERSMGRNERNVRLQGGASSAEDIIAMAVGISCAVLFVFVCLIAVLLWCLSRRNGWYITNEKDEDDEDEDEDEDEDKDEDNERVSADTALRSKQEEDD
ncbi:uncharacterized protein V6R79_013185 [Siganus canaliculatus]